MLSTLRRKLLSWFDANQRKLPWRFNRDPYAIWISEVMLQQTTVAAVIPYFESFMAKFPTVVELADAQEAEVFHLWEGLGYYRRARHLHAAAILLAKRYGKDLQGDPEFWQELPGVGRYIYGAVLSQAFETKLPIVEANSLRVWARVCGYRNDPRNGAGKAWIWAWAEKILPSKRIGDFNQAVMELGATVCKPVAPACDRCPLSKLCIGFQLGIAEAIPPKPATKVITSVREVALAIRNKKGQVLVGKRPAHVQWAGLWEFPHASMQIDETEEAACVRAGQEFVTLPVVPVQLLSELQHSITRYSIRITLWECRATREKFRSTFYEDVRWVPPSELKTLPTSRPQRQLFEEVLKPTRQLRLC